MGGSEEILLDRTQLREKRSNARIQARPHFCQLTRSDSLDEELPLAHASFYQTSRVLRRPYPTLSTVIGGLL